MTYRSSFFSFKCKTDFCVGDSGTSRVGELLGEKPWLCEGDLWAGFTIFKWFKLTSLDGLPLFAEPLLKFPSSRLNNDGLIFACSPFTVMIQGSSRSLSGFDSSLKRTNNFNKTKLEKLAQTYESEFSDSVSLSSPFWFFHFLKRSIKSIR